MPPVGLGTRESSRIRPLKDTVTLYVNDSDESKEAEKLIRAAGISVDLIDNYRGHIDPYEQFPILIWRGAGFEGIDKIRSFLRLLTHWSRQPNVRDVFSDSL